MNGMRREQTNLRSIQLNQGVVESALDELLYRPRFSANILEPFGGAVKGTGGAFEYLELPNAGNPGGKLSWPAPSAFWVKGTITLRLIWSGDTASTNTVGLQFNASTASFAAAPVGTAGPAVLLPGPAVVNGHLDYTFVTSAIPVDSSCLSVGLSIFYNAGAGTYVGKARLFGFQLIYTPAAGH